MFDFKEIYEATTVNNAIELLKKHPNAIIIAGGSDILIKIREGKISGCELVSIQSLRELRGISLIDDKIIRIGSLESFAHIADSEIIKNNIPVLRESALKVGGPQIRNIGTLGGNICNVVTSADTASILLALDAILEIVNSYGIRYVPITEFYIHAGKTNLKEDEILSSILIHKNSYEGYNGYYYKYSTRNAMDISICNCSINVKLSKDKGSIEDIRAAYGAAGPVPVRAYNSEKLIKGRKVSLSLIEEFSGAAVKDLNPRSSWRASSEFRIHILEELSKKCLTESIIRCGGLL